MGQILKTALPLASDEVTPDVYNRLVRVLELNLSAFDPDTTNSVLAGKRDQNKYNKGDVIWNLTTEELQVWDGAKWSSLYSTTSKGVSATGELGSVTVAASGATTIYL
jgi:hypothetical protein